MKPLIISTLILLLVIIIFKRVERPVRPRYKLLPVFGIRPRLPVPGIKEHLIYRPRQLRRRIVKPRRPVRQINRPRQLRRRIVKPIIRPIIKPII